MLLLFSDAVGKLLPLTQELVKSFSKFTVLLGDNKINNEWGSKDGTSMVLVLLLIFSTDVQ